MLHPHLQIGLNRVFRLRLLMLVTVVVAWLAEGRARAAETIVFSHEDRRYLEEEQHGGGAAFVPSGISREERAPVVVFLHGTNRSGKLHLWLGGGGRDLRPQTERLVLSGKVRPFILAAPSQTVDAVFGHSLWPSFDLSRFVTDLGDALGERARIDLESIYVFGHSGAGCNPEGGLVVSSGQALLPVHLVAIDPCMDAEMGEALVHRAPGLPLWVLWQTQVWRRDFAAWDAALRADATGAGPVRVTQLVAPGPRPHDSIVPLAFERALRNLLGRKDPDAASETE